MSTRKLRVYVEYAYKPMLLNLTPVALIFMLFFLTITPVMKWVGKKFVIYVPQRFRSKRLFLSIALNNHFNAYYFANTAIYFLFFPREQALRILQRVW